MRSLGFHEKARLNAEAANGRRVEQQATVQLGALAWLDERFAGIVKRLH